VPDAGRSPGSEVERVAASLVRARAVLLALAIGVPAGCHGLFERQARRLDAVAERGEVVTATVTAVTQQGGAATTHYRYEVGGATFTWEVDHADAPFDVGATFPIVVAPGDPDLSVTGSDRRKAAARAAENRAFAWKLEAGAAAFFGAFALLSHVRLGRLRATGRTDADDPVAYRQRLAITGALLLVLVAGVSLAHARDALARGEPLAPVVIAGVASIAIVVGTGAYVLRDGRGQANARSRRLLAWAVPAAIAIAVLRLAAWLVAGQR
jgi:hypothetical protein